MSVCLSVCLCLSVCVPAAGGDPQREEAVQVSRHVWVVRTEDVLEGHPGVPQGGQAAEEEV